MIKDYRNFAWPVLGIGCAIAVFFVLLFDRYRYYDFSKASCDAGSLPLTAELIGNFDAAHATSRGSPYRLRMEAKRPHGKAQVVLRDVRLVSLQSGAMVPVKGGEMSASPSADDVVVLLGGPMQLSYDDYQIQGVIAAGDAGSLKDRDFACIVRRSYRSEWRASWLDALMSV